MRPLGSAALKELQGLLVAGFSYLCYTGIYKRCSENTFEEGKINEYQMDASRREFCKDQICGY